MIPKGFRMAGTRCGLKNRRNDVGLIVSDVPSRSAGVFTRNLVRAACVEFSERVVKRGELRAIVVNSGNANCCTGEQGVNDAARTAQYAAEALGMRAEEIAVGSTGVIGQLLNMGKLEKGVRDAAKKLGTDPHPFMEAILTTDLVEKMAEAQVGEGRIFGVAKGSGMIAPNMATMLGFVVTDLDTEGIDLAKSLKAAADVSFNCMTVDGDTSTNDMLLLMANGASGVKVSAQEFQAALDEVCISLAKQIARDGEGATKLVEVEVQGTTDPQRIARTIADSPLVKTAMFGCDPNWGRIMMAAGRAGVAFDPNAARLWIEANSESHLLFEEGGPAAFDPQRVSSTLRSEAVLIRLELGEGETAKVYTCDFGYGYVRINAEYHT